MLLKRYKMINWSKKRVLVTGSEGFIGSHLVERLLELGANVRSFVLYNSFGRWGWLDSFPKDKLEKLDIFTGDIRDANNVHRAMEDIEIVFHLAALISIPYSYYSPESYVATNVTGTLNVLQAAKEKRVTRFIHTSTSETYGTAVYVPIDEKHPLQGQSPYSASKIGADMLAESFYRSFNLPVSIIRPFNTYGPRQSARAVIPTIISQIASGKKKIFLGSLDPVRDLTFVKDTVEGFIKIVESEQTIGEVINIGSGRGVSIIVLAEKMMELMRTSVQIITDKKRIRPRKSEVERLICCYSKAKKLMGWEPRWSLDEGFRETIEFIKNNLDQYKINVYNI